MAERGTPRPDLGTGPEADTARQERINALLDSYEQLHQQLGDDPNNPDLAKELASVKQDLQLGAWHGGLQHDVSFELMQAERRAGERHDADPVQQKYDELLDAYTAALKNFQTDETDEHAALRDRTRQALHAFRYSQEQGDPKVVEQAVQKGTQAYERKRESKGREALERGERNMQYQYAEMFNDSATDFDNDAEEAQTLIKQLPEDKQVAFQGKLDAMNRAKQRYMTNRADGIDFTALQRKPTLISAEWWKKFVDEMTIMQQNMLDFVENVKEHSKHS